MIHYSAHQYDDLNIVPQRGRAGRVREGTCYKLITQRTFHKLSGHAEPEIRRVALDQTLLQLMFLEIEDGSGNFMKQLLDPPQQSSLDAAVFSLEKLGAVRSGVGSDRRVLTPLGLHLAAIPSPPIVGKRRFHSRRIAASLTLHVSLQ